MRFLLGMSLLFTTSLFAVTFQTQISRIDTSARPDHESLVFLSNGRVVKASLQKTDLLNQVERNRRTNSWISVTVNANREITSVRKIASPMKTALDEEPLMAREVLEDYTPSVIPSMDAAKSFFRDHRHPKDGETQCFNRAAVWTYDWRTKKNLYSNKQWIFFTAKYIRKYNFEWWFHVAPMVHVNVDGKIKERVMDMKYARGPIATKQWSDIFMKDDAVCPTVSEYSDHADFPETGSCFLQRTSMYYYQPVDLEFREKFGTQKTAWVASEVVQAYQEAFDIYPKN